MLMFLAVLSVSAGVLVAVQAMDIEGVNPAKRRYGVAANWHAAKDAAYHLGHAIGALR